MPDKAIDVIDEVGAYLQLLPSKGAEKRTVVTNKDIETIVSLMAKVPQKTVNSNEKHKLKNLEQDLKFMIFGQDHAVEQTVNAILLARSGLSHQQKPIASFIFAGPTGVGKTELAKQLAFQLGSFFKRFDMSEYMEKHSVSKLIGAPPGYVGYDQGGLLTDAINQNPHSVLLLDEIEKAHPDIYNILLQVMDHGSLTDANGRVTDFRNVILIMTTNAGASDMENGNIGLTPAGSGKEAKRDKAIKNFFSPEFRNRLDAIIHFNQLNQQNIRMIVDKFLTELQHQLDEKKIQIEIDQATKDFIGESAFDQKLGARPIARFIDENIKKKLAKEILFGDLSSGGMIKISLKEQKIEINFSKKV
jgi:ATP-dependent Clp protease ATP-binding subunit ClpA